MTAAAPTFGEYLETNPFSADEAAKGAALRLACILRNSEGSFYEGPVSYDWILLSCVRGEGTGSTAPAAPKIMAFHGEGRLPSRVSTPKPVLLGRHRFVDASGSTWTADEYSVRIPCDCGRFVAKAGRATLKVGRSMRDVLLGDYYGRISNASIEGGYKEWLDAQVAAYAAEKPPVTGPLMSIVVPAYKTPERYLREMVESVLAQTYANWELVVVNASLEDVRLAEVLAEYAARDQRIRVVEQAQNLGIIGNTAAGIAASTGEYVCFLDHDDFVEPAALASYVKKIAELDGKVDLLYCDEDDVDEEGRHFSATLKPPYSPDLLLSNNYVCHWLCVSRRALDAIERSPEEVNGAQDFDMTLRVADFGGVLAHVPRVLYHWRAHSGSTAGDPGSKPYAQLAGELAIRAHLERLGDRADVSDGEAAFTYVTLLKPSREVPVLALVCAGEPHASTVAAAESWCARHGADLVRRTGVDELLTGDELPEGSVALLVSKGRVVGEDALETLLPFAQRPIGFAASPRTVRADGLHEWAGTIVLPNGRLAPAMRLLPRDDGGYLGRTHRPYDFSVLDPRCCLFDVAKARELVAASGDAMPAYRTLEYQFADLCARAYESGRFNVFMPYAIAEVDGPAPVLLDEPDADAQADAEAFLAAHPQFRAGDPSHNPNFDPWQLYCRLNRN